MYLLKTETLVYTRPCVWVFTVAFFIVVEEWKQPRCPSVGEWIDKTCLCPYGGILFGNKKIKPRSILRTWVSLKHTVLATWEDDPGGRLVCCTSLFLWDVQRRHGFRKTVVPRGSRWEQGATVGECEVMEMLHSCTGMRVVQLRKFTVPELCLKWLDFTSCNLCLKMVKNELNFKYSFYAYGKFIWFFPFMLLVL